MTRRDVIRFAMNTGESKNQFDVTSITTLRKCIELIRATIFFFKKRLFY